MNSNLASLIKLEIAKYLSSFNSKKKKISKTPVFYVALLILFFALLGSIGYSFLIIYPYKSTGADPAPAVSLFAGIASLLIFMTSMGQARSIYIGEDYDLLASLPIKRRDIVASKIITMFFIELVFSLVIMIPHAVVMMIMTQNVALTLIAILLAFTIPIVPLAFAILVSLLITMATAKFKAANIVFVALYALVIVGFSGMAVIVNNMRDDSQAVSSFSGIGNVLKWINPSYYFVELSLTGNKLFLLVYVALNIVTTILVVLFLSLLYEKLHDIVSSISMKKKYVRKDLKNKSEGRLYLSLEFKRLVNSKFYFVNTIMGGIMGIFGATVFLFSFASSFPKAEGDALSLMKAMLTPIFITIVCMFMGMVNPTTTCINIEGKNFWLTKSLPINYKKYLHAKLYFSWILTIPAAIVASSISLIFYHDNAVDIIFSFLIPIVYIIFNSLLGLIIALHHPKVKWNSETEAVKNCASVTIAMLIDFGITSVLAVPIIIIPIFVPNFIWVAYLALLVSLIIPSIFLYSYLRKYFGKRIDLIEDL